MTAPQSGAPCWLVLALAAGLGCDVEESTSSSGTVPASSRLADTLLSRLTSSDVVALCEETDRDTAAALSPRVLTGYACEVVGALQTTSPVACGVFRQRCERGEEPAAESLVMTYLQNAATAGSLGCAQGGQVPDCDVTVRQFTRCVDDLLSAKVELLAPLSCQNAGDQEALERFRERPPIVDTPRSCDELNAACGSNLGLE